MPKIAKWHDSVFWKQYKHCRMCCKVAICYVVIKTATRYCLGLLDISLAHYRQWESQFRNKGKIFPQPKKRKTSLHRHVRMWVSFSHSSPFNCRSKLGGSNEKQARYKEWDSYFVCSSKNRRCAGFILIQLCNGGGCCLQTTSTVRELRLINSMWLYFKSLLRQSWWQSPLVSPSSSVPQLTEQGTGKIEQAGRSQHLKISWGFPTPFWKARVGKMRLSPDLNSR